MITTDATPAPPTPDGFCVVRAVLNNDSVRTGIHILGVPGKSRNEGLLDIPAFNDHAVREIVKYLRKGEIPQKGMQMWY